MRSVIRCIALLPSCHLLQNFVRAFPPSFCSYSRGGEKIHETKPKSLQNEKKESPLPWTAKSESARRIHLLLPRRKTRMRTSSRRVLFSSAKITREKTRRRRRRRRSTPRNGSFPRRRRKTRRLPLRLRRKKTARSTSPCWKRSNSWTRKSEQS